MAKFLKIKYEPASKGIAIGRARVINASEKGFPKYWIADKEISAEIARFKSAVIKSKHQLSKIKEKLCRFQGKEQIQIIDAHSMLLQDEMLITHALQNITGGKINAEWAIDKASARLKMAFVDMRDEYFRQRKHDIDYISQRIIKNLTGSADTPLYELSDENIVIVANDLSPGDIVNLQRERVKGFITATGGNTSHSAIIARSLEIPAMVGVEQILKQVSEGDRIVIDGINGEILINPPKTEMAKYKKLQEEHEKEKRLLLKDVHLLAETIDGRRMELVANIELTEEVGPALIHGAEGIGLFRTEYLYANRMDYPTEEEQFNAYKTVLEQMEGRPTTIRTADIGGDKLFAGNLFAEHLNPALGLRAVRLCLAEKDLFRTQIRALLRASPFGNLKMLLPMISGLDELNEVKKFIAEVKATLLKEKKKVSEDIKLGIMIEIPSAVVVSDILAKEVDFFSIGTNDLIQYTLAVDRTNEHVAYLYNLLNPAVIRMLKTTVESARNAGIEVTVCGESAGDPLYLALFLGLGINSLSMNTVSIPRVKRLLRIIKGEEADNIAEKILKTNTIKDIEKIIAQDASKYLKFFEHPKPVKA